jgi:hypothetical protein
MHLCLFICSSIFSNNIVPIINSIVAMLYLTNLEDEKGNVGLTIGEKKCSSFREFDGFNYKLRKDIHFIE